MAAGHDLSSGIPAVESETHLDVLSDVLRTVRLSGALFFSLDISAPWTSEIPGGDRFGPLLLPDAQNVVSYHIVTRGTCWAAISGGDAVKLGEGDIIVVPHGHPYVMSTGPCRVSGEAVDEALAFFRQMSGAGAPSRIAEGGGGSPTAELVCGFLGCDTLPFNPVLQALPPLVIRRHPAGRDPLDALIEFALAESRQRRSGTHTILLRLSEVLFVEVIRRYLDELSASDGCWLAGLRDPIVGRALALLHDRPAAAWTLEALAREIAISRSVLAERFTRFVGQPPMRYLTQWRMQLASRLLAEQSLKISAVALQVGYESEAAFSRAFKKFVGVPPAAWRRSMIASNSRSNPG